MWQPVSAVSSVLDHCLYSSKDLTDRFLSFAAENVDSFPSLRILEVLGVTQPSKFIQSEPVVVKQSNTACKFVWTFYEGVG